MMEFIILWFLLWGLVLLICIYAYDRREKYKYYKAASKPIFNTPPGCKTINARIAFKDSNDESH